MPKYPLPDRPWSTPAHESQKYSLKNQGLNGLDIAHLEEPNTVFSIALEYTINNADMEMDLRIERGAKAMDKGDRPNTGALSCTGAMGAQIGVRSDRGRYAGRY